MSATGWERPPFELTFRLLGLVEELGRLIGRFEGLSLPTPQPRLRRENRIRTVQGSIAIEGNTFSPEQVTALLEGKHVVGSQREILEVQNANAAYELAPRLNPASQRDLLRAHRVLMKGLIPDAGRFRTGNVGVMKGARLTHLAPPARLVPQLMKRLLCFVEEDTAIPGLLRACVAHCEIEFIHPFSDGNGRMGRLWQQVALLRESPAFGYLPVESLIHERQKAYYDALRDSDREGRCTVFLEFSLTALRDTLASFLEELRPGVETADQRLTLAHDQFGSRWFTRRDYLSLHKALSTASASRDLRRGFDQKLLERRGDKALAEYRFRR